MLELDFVQHFPIGNGVVIAGFMPLAEFVGKSALCIPGEKAAVVVADLFHAGIAEFGALRVIPYRLVRIGRVATGLSVLNIHCGMVLKFRMTEWPLVASRKSMVMGSMRKNPMKSCRSPGAQVRPHPASDRAAKEHSERSQP